MQLSVSRVAPSGKELIIIGLSLTLSYVILFKLNNFFVDTQHYLGVASIVFLPAFVRLLGYLLIGLWIIPVLFVAGCWLVLTGQFDLAPGHSSELIITGMTAVGGPLGIAIVARFSSLQPSLNNLTPLRLLALSFGCAAGNAILHYSSLVATGTSGGPISAPFIILAGDMIGTWIIIYLIKLAMECIPSGRGRPDGRF